ncbi:aldose 1-epimerase family protein [Arthrobacter mobilis]|uniref:Aldose 1-epimerase family protein n=1 Tax=Arthrobacter mobilis TaxID=2724944 RepID=A0A7X6K631_9MICC|nr:aldose 1-epimerase family protein [Arthrobacter mobilis]NKX54293.1 aldose 1-epimerase family protein [Arthrobacter mobilis]
MADPQAATGPASAQQDGGEGQVFPSGRQYGIRHGDQLAVITEVGGALREYRHGDRPLIDGYGAGEICTGGRGQPLIPWPNRIGRGSYTWAGRQLQLDLSEPDKGGAIHGLTRWANWRADSHAEDRVSFSYTLHACQGWEWVLDCRLDYLLDDGGLSVRTTATNRSPTACPYGTGAHPYLSTGAAAIDADLAQVPGDTYLPVDEAGLPLGRKPVEGTPYDLRSLQELGARQIDVAYTDLSRDPDGRARVRLIRPDRSAGVELWADEGYRYLEIFTGDTLPQPERRRTGLGVEPMTCAPDAFNSGEGLVSLEPGQTHSASWGINPFPAL